MFIFVGIAKLHVSKTMWKTLCTWIQSMTERVEQLDLNMRNFSTLANWVCSINKKTTPKETRWIEIIEVGTIDDFIQMSKTKPFEISAISMCCEISHFNHPLSSTQFISSVLSTLLRNLFQVLLNTFCRVENISIVARSTSSKVTRLFLSFVL